jgi:hypothetical protein
MPCSNLLHLSCEDARHIADDVGCGRICEGCCTYKPPAAPPPQPPPLGPDASAAVARLLLHPLVYEISLPLMAMALLVGGSCWVRERQRRANVAMLLKDHERLVELERFEDVQCLVNSFHGWRAKTVRLRAQRFLRSEDTKGCTFYFVRASYVAKTTAQTLPTFQQLRDTTEDVLVPVHVKRSDVLRGEFADGRYCAVSHRWLNPQDPDRPEGSSADVGEQLRKLQEHLSENPQIEWVWFDFSCMPQGQRTSPEDAEFRTMITHVNLLYLGCHVLILLDLSYLSRFWTQVRDISQKPAPDVGLSVWPSPTAPTSHLLVHCASTQLEAWLSMQTVSAHGLTPAGVDQRRFAIKRLYDKHSICEELLINMWQSKSPLQAYETLRKPDVEVTSKSDKEKQLPKVMQLHEDAKLGHYLYLREPYEELEEEVWVSRRFSRFSARKSTAFRSSQALSVSRRQTTALEPLLLHQAKGRKTKTGRRWGAGVVTVKRERQAHGVDECDVEMVPSTSSPRARPSPAYPPCPSHGHGA